jgi:ribose 5-phosphate isomerase B
MSDPSPRPLRIAVGSDHAGFHARQTVMATLRELGVEVQDLGTETETSCDYPDYAVQVAQRVARKEADFGVLCCGTGIGMSIAANKVAGIRAAVCHNDFTCEMARRHNDANVLCLGGRVVDDPTIAALVRLFLRTPFEGGRHLRRVKEIADLDRGR